MLIRKLKDPKYQRNYLYCESYDGRALRQQKTSLTHFSECRRNPQHHMSSIWSVSLAIDYSTYCMTKITGRQLTEFVLLDYRKQRSVFIDISYWITEIITLDYLIHRTVFLDITYWITRYFIVDYHIYCTEFADISYCISGNNVLAYRIHRSWLMDITYKIRLWKFTHRCISARQCWDSAGISQSCRPWRNRAWS